MMQTDLQPSLRAREGWRRRRRRDRLMTLAGWTLTTLALCWLLLVALAGLRPA
jgi:type II secretory pathway component PulM